MANGTLRKADVREILAATYPGYRGRKFGAELLRDGRYLVQDHWSGGTRYYVKAVTRDPETGRLVVRGAAAYNPITVDHSRLEIEVPDDVLLVEHVYFCGRDLGIRFRMTARSTWTRELPFSRVLALPQPLEALR